MKRSKRITVIRPDGVVVGDSERDPLGMENHGDRLEVRRSLENTNGVGQTTRFSDTLEKEFIYVAVVAYQEETPAVIVRMSLPITDVRRQLDRVDRGILVVGFLAIVMITFISPWMTLRFGRRRERSEPKAP